MKVGKWLRRVREENGKDKFKKEREERRDKLLKGRKTRGNYYKQNGKGVSKVTEVRWKSREKSCE